MPDSLLWTIGWHFDLLSSSWLQLTEKMWWDRCGHPVISEAWTFHWFDLNAILDPRWQKYAGKSEVAKIQGEMNADQYGQIQWSAGRQLFTDLNAIQGGKNMTRDEYWSIWSKNTTRDMVRSSDQQRVNFSLIWMQSKVAKIWPENPRWQKYNRSSDQQGVNFSLGCIWQFWR